MVEVEDRALRTDRLQSAGESSAVLRRDPDLEPAAAEAAELALGQVTARGWGEEDSSEDACGIADDGRLHLSSPCRVCDFDGLCGRTYEVAEVVEVGEVAE